MNTEKETLTGVTSHDLKKKMSPTRDINTMCPAVMFANKRIMRANGFVNNEMISMGTMIGNMYHGAPPRR